MENQKENQEKDKFGNVTFGEASRLLIDIIGQNVILESMPEEEREAFKRSLERMYKGKANYSKFAVAEPESPQWYVTQFFEKILEERYELSRLAMIIVDSFTWQLFYALCTTTFEKPKKETALYLIRKELFNLIYHSLVKGESLSDGSVFKIPGDSIITFLTDSYDKIFKDIESLFKNEKIFYEEINNYCRDNYKKYPKFSKNDEKIDYKQNINNWRNNGVYNTNWFVLVPVLDFLRDQNKKDLVHRLIGLYLLKNAQRVIKEVLGISEQEQEKIITDIVTMIRDNKNPEEFYNDNDFVFPEHFNLIFMCLAYQHQINFDAEKSNDIIKAIEDKCDNSNKFFSSWLKARASVFEKGESLKDNKEEKDKVIDGYKRAFDDGVDVAHAGGYLAQFLLEAILINRFCNPRRVKDIDDYYGYGYALELFSPEKEKLLDIIKESSDPRMEFIKIHYSNFSPMGQVISQHYPDLYSDLLSLEKIIEKARLINNKGLEFEKMGNFELAIQCFSNAIMLNPVYVNAYSERGYVYKKMSEYNIEYIENALDDFNMALLLDQKHENTLLNRGLLLLKKGQYENAITDFTNLINIKPEDSEAYYNRGNCYGYLENYTRAIKDFNKAIEINPNYAEALYIRSSVHELMGNDDKAQEDLRKALEINPKPYLEDIFYKGFYYNFKLKKNDEAIERFTEAIRIDPKLSPSYSNRGNCYFQKGAYDEAISDYDTALSFNPQNIDVYKIREWALYFKKWSESHTNHIDVLMIVNRAIENAQERKYDLALNDFEQILRMCSNNAFVFYQRGLMYAEINEPVKAIKDFIKTIELAPTVATVYYDRGNMYLNREIYDRAIEDYTMAITIYPKFSDAICNRGIAYDSQKEYKLAIDDFNAVLQINPDDDDAKDYLQKYRRYS